MPLYTFRCNTCHASDDRFLSLAEWEGTHDKQQCACGALMRQVIGVPVLAGLDSGPTGFMRGRNDGNDGCCDNFTRRRVERNLGHKLGGGMFVGGLCRPGVPFDPQAVCHSREEVIQKARKLGVAVRGPGINVDPREPEPVVDDGVPSEQAIQNTLREEVQQNYGGKVTRKQYRQLVEKLQDKHARRGPPVAKPINSIYGGQ